MFRNSLPRATIRGLWNRRKGVASSAARRTREIPLKKHSLPAKVFSIL